MLVSVLTSFIVFWYKLKALNTFLVGRVYCLLSSYLKRLGVLRLASTSERGNKHVNNEKG
jgi:hypothetical protein